jgi:uncharacterized protein
MDINTLLPAWLFPASLFPYGGAQYLLGGVLIGAGVSLLFVMSGLIGGMSTFYSALWSFVSKRPFFQQPKFLSTRNWRIAYAVGLIAGALLVTSFWVGPKPTALPLWQLGLGGVIAGFGARMSNGCTSGHGICGLASMQLPSLLAVCIFLGTAMLASRVVLMIGGV